MSRECRWINFPDEGSITVEGPFLRCGRPALAFTGGTEAYREARGSMGLVPNEDGTEFTFVFRILGA